MNETAQSELDISVIIPIYNEEQTIPFLLQKLKDVLDKSGFIYELIAVDDGSLDHSLELLKAFQQNDPSLRIVELSRNFGQHPALAAGFSVAMGKVLVTIDADLQIDPLHIPALVHKVRDGYDFVSGIRKGRNGSLLKRRIPSYIVNRLVGKVAGKRLRDFGCPLNAFTIEIARLLPEYGEMQRFFKPLAVRLAQNVAEIEVVHNERMAGNSKYNMLNLVDLFFDFITNFSKQLFQRVALLGLALSAASSAAGMGYLAARFILQLVQNPMERLQAIILFCLLFGLQLVVLGILGDFVIRTYRKVEGSPIYIIKHLQVRDPNMLSPKRAIAAAMHKHTSKNSFDEDLRWQRKY